MYGSLRPPSRPPIALMAGPVGGGDVANGCGVMLVRALLPEGNFPGSNCAGRVLAVARFWEEGRLYCGEESARRVSLRDMAD